MNEWLKNIKGRKMLVKINGKAVHIINISVYMDEDLRDEITRDYCPCTAQQFANAYCRRHKAKFGTDFVVD